jgi:hypothetical protein
MRTSRIAWVSVVLFSVFGVSLLAVWLVSAWLDLRFNPSVVAAVSASVSAAAIAASERRKRLNHNG